MLDAIIAGVSGLLNPEVWGLLIAGSIVGLITGALPGLSGMIAMAVLLPFTFGWDPGMALYFLIAVFGASPFGGSIPAIILNTPGTAPNVVTCLDGYPMARKGQADTAIAISAVSSGIGALIGVGVLIALLPFLRQIVLAFAAPEYFWLIIIAFACVAYTSRENLVKGFVATAVGVLLAFIGISPILGVKRYTAGMLYLYDGLPLIPLLIGLFAISVVIDNFVRGEATISREKMTGQLSRAWDGAKFVLSRKVTLIRGSLLGTVIGIIPVLGAMIPSFVSYTVTKQTSRHPETFGQGEPEGVLASEAASNSKDGGALVPTLAFGIPGSPPMAILLAALLLHGVAPGPLFLRDNLDLAWVMIVALVVSNVIASTAGLLLASRLARITTIKLGYITPVVLVLCFLGAFVMKRNIWDVVLMLGAGVFGYGMMRGGYPAIGLLMGFILGVLAEKYIFQTPLAFGTYAALFTRPIALALFCVFVAIILFPVAKTAISRLKKRRQHQ